MTEPPMDAPLLGRCRFRVTWDERAVPGVSSVSALRMSGLDSTTAGRVAEPVEFVRACTADRAFERWADDPTPKTVRVDLLDPSGTPRLAFVLADCVPVGYVLLVPLDASSDAVAIERLEVRCRSMRSGPVG